MSELSTIFSRANCLTASEPLPDLKSTLSARLSRYYELRTAKPDNLQQLSLEDLQYLTAKEALNSVSEIQAVLGSNASAEKSDAGISAALGTRDLAQLRTLLSVIFKWGTAPLLTSCLRIWPSKAVAEAKITSLEETSRQYQSLVEFTISLMGILFPSGSSGPLLNTHVTAVLINRHLVDLLKPCFALGWLPKSLVTGPIITHDPLRPVTLRLLSVLPPLQAITALGGVLSSKQEPSLHMRRISTMLLGKQITRPEGVNGLCAAVFGEEEVTGEEAPLEKLEHISRVLTTVPYGTQPQEYFQPVVHQLLSSLSESRPSAHKRAAAFTVSRMLASDSSHYHVEICSQQLLASLHDKFLRTEDPIANAESGTSQPSSVLDPSTAISVLTTLVANMDPHPASISRLLSPIISELYSLLNHLDKVKTSDPGLRESLHGLLVTWGKIIEKAEGLDRIWAIYHQAEEIYWNIDLTGNIWRVYKPLQKPSLSLFTPESLKEAEKSGSLDNDANIMDLYPDPTHYVHFVKVLDRPDIASDLFVRFLESYREQRFASGADPLQTLLTLQIVMQMQKQLTTSPSSSNLLCKPAHMLQFIKHVLESSEKISLRSIGPQSRAESDVKFRKSRLKDTENQDIGYESGDSDDYMPDSETVSPNDEMVETAINLLLSILEANEDLSARTTPVLNDIYSLLEPMSREGSTSIRSIAREAKMVMTARLASTSTMGKARSDDEESSREIYQKALKLLQDPILPVRAHGLLLLRQLINRSKDEVEPALIPAILSIFLQSVQDDESYLFLNAVQGLSAMVDSYGKEVLKTLIREYCDGLFNMGRSSASQHDLDVRTRVGEALGIVIRRCGSALVAYSDLLIPPLFRVIRSQDVPTVLRTSSLSLLADCVNTYALAVLPYVIDLVDAMIDLLQVEGVPAKEAPLQRDRSAEPDADAEDGQESQTMDSQPLSTNSKFPPFRRAALHFLSLLIRSLTEQAYEKSFTDVHVYMSVLQRAKTTLAYVALTDEDAIVRVKAREAGEGLLQLQEAILGL
ncbi:hypothetical protein AX15_004502 [Amanita polypyramis BW_CC]|nr:hypothetical protein AX15_004502 [Amanita polypyramis BW_CC]